MKPRAKSALSLALASDGGVTYTYDAAGNRTTRTENGSTVTYTLGVGDRLASWTGGAYTHDAAGNVTRIERDGRPTLDLTRNSQYQLVSVATNGVFAESYEYDALGRRVSTTTTEGMTRHVYDDNWQVVADVDTNGNVIASYVWGDGIDNLLAVTVGGVSYYPLTDIQGTVWGYVDSQNNVVARWRYDAWGNVVDEFVSPSATTLSRIRYRFQCREWFKLNRADVGWYQIRQSLKAYGESSEGRPIDFSAFDSAYAALTAKLRPQVFEYGFLKT